MKILITGSRGMVGQNILRHPGVSQFEVLAPGRAELDFSSYKSSIEYIQKNKPDFVIHAAGKVGGIQANIKNPVAFLVENLDINRNLIMSCREAGVKKLINLGSSCMYPRNVEGALTEDMVLSGELEPTNEGYAIAKIAAQRLCSYISSENPEFSYKTMIPCNIYGQFDKFSPEHSHMVPAVIRKLHEAKVNSSNKVDIWGDGLASREFMYAGDLADCILFGVNNFEAMPKLMNVGLGYDYTINQYYAAAAKVIGYNGDFEHDLTKPVGMKRKLVSTKLLDAWGWKAKTSLEDGISKAYEYFLSL